jgi:hypothetical protein
VLAVAVWTVLHFSFQYALRDLSTPEIDVLDCSLCSLLLDVAGPSGTVGSTSWIACLALR